MANPHLDDYDLPVVLLLMSLLTAKAIRMGFSEPQILSSRRYGPPASRARPPRIERAWRVEASEPR